MFSILICVWILFIDSQVYEMKVDIFFSMPWVTPIIEIFEIPMATHFQKSPTVYSRMELNLIAS